jgi:hypothetical protein
MSKAWQGGSTARWRKIRAAVLAENLATDGGRCQAVVPGVCTGLAEQVHHTLGRGVTGDDPRYLLPVCRACNLHIGEPGKVSPPHRTASKW